MGKLRAWLKKYFLEIKKPAAAGLKFRYFSKRTIDF